LLLAALAISLSAPLGCFGQPAPNPAAGPKASDPPAGLADDEADWVLGFAAFRGRDLSPENLHLLHSIPLLLQRGLTSVGVHYFTAEEKLGYRKAVIQRALRKRAAALETLRRERDALLFKESDPAVRESKTGQYDLKIREAVEELNRLAALPPEAVEFPDSKPIRLAAGDRDEALLAAPLFSPLQAALQKSVNRLVWGRVEEVQGFLYLEVHALDAALQRDTFTYNDALARDELGAAIEQLVEGLKRDVWGRDWASLAVRTDPPQAAIYLDGVLVGAGQARLDFIAPGQREVRVELEGYAAQTRTVDLQSYTLLELEVELEKLERPTIRLTSEPPGAAVYRGSTWLGETPLQLSEPDSPDRILLRLRGCRDLPLYLGGGAGDRPEAVLSPLSRDPLEAQKKARDRFYKAFGLFALSVPFPFFCWGLAGDYWVAVNYASTYEEAVRLYGCYSGFYWGMWATLGLSATLAVNMILQLARYIRAADRRG